MFPPDDSLTRWFDFIRANYPQLLQGTAYAAGQQVGAAPAPAGVGSISPPPAPTLQQNGTLPPPPGAFQQAALPPMQPMTPIQQAGVAPQIKTVVKAATTRPPQSTRSQAKRQQLAV